MNGIIPRIFALGLLVAVAHALQCYKCDFGLGDLCLTTEETCKAGEHCFSGEAKAVGFLPIKTKGCLAEAQCNKSADTMLPGKPNTTIYTVYKTCCNSDLCNAAPGLNGLPLMPLMLASITSLLMATVVV